VRSLKQTQLKMLEVLPAQFVFNGW